MTELDYQLELSERAQQTLSSLDRRVQRLIRNRLKWLVVNVASIEHYAMKGQWRGLYRLHAGDFRIIYRLETSERLIVVEKIGHRRDVYKD